MNNLYLGLSQAAKYIFSVMASSFASFGNRISLFVLSLLNSAAVAAPTRPLTDRVTVQALPNPLVSAYENTMRLRLDSPTIDDEIAEILRLIERVDTTETNFWTSDDNDLFFHRIEAKLEQLKQSGMELPGNFSALEDTVKRILLPRSSPSAVSGTDFEENSRLYGNKSANLIELRTLFDSDPTVQVPFFTALSHDRLKAVLEEKIPEFSALWAEFTASGGDGSSSILERIQTKIKEAFLDEHAIDLQLEDFLSHVDGRPIMVRSSGKEDSVAVSNPGGNTSICNVSSEKKAVCKAVGEVLASYFSSKSLNQRKALGDDITSFPQLSVLIQVMVGEKEGSDIPSSGVMYTREAEMLTPGVVQICSTFGHAEAVVTGDLPTDTFFVHDHHIHATVKEKTLRKKPGLSGSLVSAANPSSIRKSPSLSPSVIFRLQGIAKKIEEHYKMPMDIEWSYDPKEDIIHVFQARPIPAKAESTPSFIATEKLKDLENLQKVTILGGANLSVMEVSSENTLFAASAPAALEVYLRHADPKPKVVVIKETTAANSHEAAFFRSVQVPIVFVPSTHFESVKSQLTRPALIDVQQGVIGSLPEGRTKEEFLVDGVKRFIGPKEESHLTGITLPLEEIRQIREELNSVLEHIDREKLDLKIRSFSGSNKIEQLLNALDSMDTIEEKKYVLFLLSNVVEKVVSKAPDGKAQFLSQYYYNLSHVLKADETTFRFAAHWLKVACLDEPLQEVSCGVSLRTLLTSTKELQLIGEHEEPFKGIFLHAQKYIIDKAAREQWSGFVDQLSDDDLKKLASFMRLIGKDQITPFLNIFFPRYLESAHGDLAAILSAIEADFSRPEFLETMNFLEIAQTQLQKMELLASKFQEKDSFEEALEKLDQEFIPFITALSSQMSRSRGLETLLLGNIYKKTIDHFDNCIKNFVGSSYETDEQVLKAERFSKILKFYLVFLNQAYTQGLLNHDEKLKKHAGMLIYHLGQKILDNSKRLTAATAANLLQGSRGFSVNYAALGSSAAPSRAGIKSFEDIFTTIHQSLMTVLSSQQTKLDIDMTKFSEPVFQAHQAIMQLNLAGNSHRVRHEPVYPTLQFVEIHYPEIRIGYNCPLNNHSAQIVLSAHLDAEGNIHNLQLDTSFFASANLAGMVGRAEILRLYAWHAMVQDEITAPSEVKVDTAELIWPLPASEDDAILKKGIRHIQVMIDFLQQDGFDRSELCNLVDSNFINIMKAHPIAYEYTRHFFNLSHISERELDQAFFKIVAEKFAEKKLDQSILRLFICMSFRIKAYLYDYEEKKLYHQIVRAFWEDQALQNGIWDTYDNYEKGSLLFDFKRHIEDLKAVGFDDVDIVFPEYIRKWLRKFDAHFVENPMAYAAYNFNTHLKRLVALIPE